MASEFSEPNSQEELLNYNVTLDSDNEYDLENSDNEIFLGEVDRLLSSTPIRGPRYTPLPHEIQDDSEIESESENDDPYQYYEGMDEEHYDDNDYDPFADADNQENGPMDVAAHAEGFLDVPRNANVEESSSENEAEEQPDNPPEDLCIDVDNLRQDQRTGDEMHDVLNYDPDWTKQFKPIHIRRFTQPQGPNLPANFDTAGPAIDYFKLFFTDDVLQKIVRNTNKYVKYQGNVKRRTNARYVEKHWPVDLTIAELKAFLGLSIIFGLVTPKRYKFAWSSDPYLSIEPVKKIMPLRRYEKISEYFHVSDREVEFPKGHAQFDRLAKVRWLIDWLNEAFPKYMNPQKQQAVDEGLIKYSGRCNFIQYNKNKPVKRGIKLWIRADAKRAYCQQFKIYLGKGSEPTSKNGVYFDVVWDLVKAIQGKNHFIYFDNLYSSIPLLRFLYSKHFYAVGTIRKNSKHLPEAIKNCPKLERGQYRMYQSKRLSNLTAAIWWDTKEVRFVSTMSNPTIRGNVVRRVNGHYRNVPIPTVGLQYQNFFNGVDKLDALVSKKVYGAIGHNSKKMWKHVFFYLVNLAIANAFILFKCTCTRGDLHADYDQFAFRLELAKQLIGGFTCRKRSSTRKTVPVLGEPTIAGHRLCHMMAKRPKRCIPHRTYVPNGQNKKETVYGCQQCNQHMCAPCFRLCHTAT